MLTAELCPPTPPATMTSYDKKIDTSMSKSVEKPPYEGLPSFSTTAPPPYTHGDTSPRWHHDEKCGTSPTRSHTSPPSSSTQPSSHLMHVMYEGWSMNRARILSTDKSQILYRLEFHTRKPNIVISDSTTGVTLGTVTYHGLKSRMDTTVLGNDIPLTSKGIMHCKYHFTSAAIGDGKVFWWHIKNWKMDLECRDESGEAVAQFRFSAWNTKKAGTLELWGEGMENPGLKSEILVTGVGLVECMFNLRTTSLIAAGSKG
ncbi:MAG: hypothetical protein Q9174_003418 [Haloplaca sp. 1 TL-2023]